MINRLLKIMNFKSASYVFIANVLVKVLSFAIFYLLAKHLSVKDYGILTITLALITTITDLINSGLNSSIIRAVAKYRGEDNYKKINLLISTMFYNYVIVGFIVLFLFIYFSKDISNLLFKENYSFLIIWTSIGVLFTFLYGIFLAVFQGFEDYKKYMIQMISLQIIRLFGLILLILFNLFYLDYIVMLYALTPLISILIGKSLIRQIVDISYHYYDFKIIKEISDFGKWMVLWSIFVIIQSRINIYLLSILTSVEEVSFFDIANKFLGLTMLIFTSYGVVLNPKFSKLKDKEEIRYEFKKLKIVIIFFSLYLMICSFVVPLLINLIFGNKYESSVVPLIILILSSIPYVWNMPYNACLFALGKSKIFFIESLIIMVVTIIASFFLLPRYGATGAVISQGISTIVSLFISRTAYTHYMNTEEK